MEHKKHTVAEFPSNTGTAGFRNQPVLGRLWLRLLVKENIILDFLKTDYK